MLKYIFGALSDQSTDDLRSKQAEVDAGVSHEERYQKAKALFGRKTPKRAFDEIRSVLSANSPAGNACYYCERDRYRDIEHIWPKRHYPEHCFSWQNYVYACTICNQDAKRDKFAVFQKDDEYVVFDRTLPFDQPVPQGDPVQIDIRSEDPLEFLQLDLLTGRFVAIGSNLRSRRRGEYTRDLFDLDNDALCRIRKQAVNHFYDYLSRFVKAKSDDRTDDAARLLVEIGELPFPTVLAEMRRQSNTMPLLAELFKQIPTEVGART